MPPRARSPLPKSLQPQYPAADSATFKDLLLFEERLKRNAGLLKRKKARYQLYLALLVSTIVILSSDVLLETVLFELPLNTALSYYFSYRYPEYKEESHVYAELSQYVKTCALFVLGMTLFLFFASGMYSEKVGYANKYVPHANKALRSFNMYLNVRTQPLPSRLSRMASSLGLGFFFPPPKPPPPPPTAPSSPTTTMSMMTTSIPPRMRTRSLSPSFSSSSRDSGISTVPPFHPSSSSGSINYYGSASTTEIIPPIPPSTNPRGELIFSSRVHAGFREQYERYRENYERKRMLSGGAGASSSTAAAAANAAAQPRMVKSWFERLRLPFPFVRMDSSLTNVDTPPTVTPDAGDALLSFSPGSLRGRTVSLKSTPSASRRSSPAPGNGSGGGTGTGTSGRKGSRRSRGGKVSRQGTPLLEIVEVLGRSGSTSGAMMVPDLPAVVTAEPAEYRPEFGDGSAALVEVPPLGTGADGVSLSPGSPGEMGATRRRGSKGRRGSAGGGGPE